LVPELTGSQFVGALETGRLPYVVRPYHLHDFLEKVSDLLVEVKAIEAPIRQVRYEFGSLRKKKKQAARSNSMFASRDSYGYTDEELAEYEKQEAESSKTKRNKPRTNLGGSHCELHLYAGRALSLMRRPASVELRIQPQNRAVQNFHSVLHLLRGGVLHRRMADSPVARHKNHSHWSKSRHVLR